MPSAPGMDPLQYRRGLLEIFADTRPADADVLCYERRGTFTDSTGSQHLTPLAVNSTRSKMEDEDPVLVNTYFLL